MDYSPARRTTGQKKVDGHETGRLESEANLKMSNLRAGKELERLEEGECGYAGSPEIGTDRVARRIIPAVGSVL